MYKNVTCILVKKVQFFYSSSVVDSDADINKAVGQGELPSLAAFASSFCREASVSMFRADIEALVGLCFY